MKELQSIVDAAAEAERVGAQTILATVVHVEGSTYRRPGAHLLVTEDGRYAGSISGGCLERDLVERARTLAPGDAPSVVTYNTTDDDLIAGFGSGCRGGVRILVERPGRRRRPGILATVYYVGGLIGAACGERILLPEESDANGDIRDADLRSRVAADARAALAVGRSTSKAYSLVSGRVHVFFDVIRPPVSLVICGAGRDALPVVRLAREMGWRVTVVGWRPALATREAVPLAHEIVLSASEALSQCVRLEQCDAALVMTHNALQDRALLGQLLSSPVPYIGVLGPRARTHDLLLELQSQGATWTDAQLARLHAPVGLDIGAEEPETIALAVLAEIQAFLAGRPGGRLRDKAGPIHSKSAPHGAGTGKAT